MAGVLFVAAGCGSTTATAPLDPTAEANAWIEGHNANPMLAKLNSTEADCIRRLYATFDQTHLRLFRAGGKVATDSEGDRWYNGLVACQAL